MGLDLVVEGCARPGHEAEWRRLIERLFAGEERPSQADIARFREISIPACERIGAPRVNHDPAANEWILKARGAKTPEEATAILKEYDGYYAVRLVKCDGVPEYSHGDLYQGADGTSLRGQILKECSEVLSAPVIADAWNHKMPDEAVAYGKSLLAAADDATKAGALRSRIKSLLAIIRIVKERESMPLPEQIDTVRGAGLWFIFWGERGHPIRAWF